MCISLILILLTPPPFSIQLIFYVVLFHNLRFFLGKLFLAQTIYVFFFGLFACLDFTPLPSTLCCSIGAPNVDLMASNMSKLLWDILWDICLNSLSLQFTLSCHLGTYMKHNQSHVLEITDFLLVSLMTEIQSKKITYIDCCTD